MLRLLPTIGPLADNRYQPAPAPDPLRALAERARAGETAAQRTLLNAAGAPMLRAVRGVLGAASGEVDDVLQEAYVALLAALPRFRGECTTLHFACRVAVLTAMNARRRRRFAPLPDADGVLEGDGAPNPAEVVDQDRLRQILRQLIDELPETQAEVLVEHVILGHTTEETATLLGVPLNTVRSRLRRALAALRDRVQKNRRLFEVIRGGHEG
ncbi:MAG: sigma-70 family RNA polymerase sigma factor [Polyangiaceae bacterium]|nr:sigma-70 family RNA polymerase sigma factor [Polyangiaceae bacterium]